MRNKLFFAFPFSYFLLLNDDRKNIFILHSMIHTHSLPWMFCRCTPYLGIAEFSAEISVQAVTDLTYIGSAHNYERFLHICRLALWLQVNPYETQSLIDSVFKGFNVYACDPNRNFLEKAAHELGIKEYCKEDRKKFSMVFEATPNANTITEGMIAERCLVSTPGIPCGLPEEVGKKYRVDLVMEPLFIGVASMLYSVI